jgi:hypothetical protein
MTRYRILSAFILLAVMRLWFLVHGDVSQPFCVDTDPNDTVHQLVLSIHNLRSDLGSPGQLWLYKVDIVARLLSIHT